MMINNPTSSLANSHFQGQSVTAVLTHSC